MSQSSLGKLLGTECIGYKKAENSGMHFRLRMTQVKMRLSLMLVRALVLADGGPYGWRSGVEDPEPRGEGFGSDVPVFTKKK